MSEFDKSGIDIVIPNWNGRSMLETCLPSLQRQSSRNFQVTIVDNGSEDGSCEFVRNYFPSVNLIEFHENKGFSVAVNRGIESGNHPLVLLLNNDTELDKHCISILLEQSRNEMSTDMFALKMLSFHQRKFLDGAGDGVLRGGVGYRLGSMEKDGPDYGLKRQVFGACAGAGLYRRTLFDKIGMFDEDFFAYLEDVDFNMRAARSGSRCIYLPEAIVYHIGSATSGSKINDFTVKLSTRNNIFVLAKNYSVPMLLRFLPALLIYQFFWLVFVIKKKQFGAYAKGLGNSLNLISTMARKRKQAGPAPRITESTFMNLMRESEKDVLQSIMNRREQHGKSNKMFQLYLRLLC